jgi:hypothetical protein
MYRGGNKSTFIITGLNIKKLPMIEDTVTNGMEER